MVRFSLFLSYSQRLWRIFALILRVQKAPLAGSFAGLTGAHDHRATTLHRKFPGAPGQLLFLPSQGPQTTQAQTRRPLALRSTRHLHPQMGRLVPSVRRCHPRGDPCFSSSRLRVGSGAVRQGFFRQILDDDCLSRNDAVGKTDCRATEAKEAKAEPEPCGRKRQLSREEAEGCEGERVAWVQILSTVP